MFSHTTSCGAVLWLVQYDWEARCWYGVACCGVHGNSTGSIDPEMCGFYVLDIGDASRFC